jgi:hypothetical protein
LSGSPAIDAGDPDAVAQVDGVPLYDERGASFSRVRDGNGNAMAVIDIGAFELQATPPALLGDYNHNNVVDSADYIVWRAKLGQSVANYSSADGNGNGIIDSSDYSVWNANFGQSSGPGSGSASKVGTVEALSSQRPESAASSPRAATNLLPTASSDLPSLFGLPASKSSSLRLSPPTSPASIAADDALLTWLALRSGSVPSTALITNHARETSQISDHASNATVDAAWQEIDFAESLWF